MSLIDDLVASGYLKTKKIIDAFRAIKREDFLPEEMKDLAGVDRPLPVGFGQTNSQPLVVAFMLELLQPEPGDKVLDIGSGSGWTSTLLAYMVGEKGKVVAIEIIPQLATLGKENISKYNFIKEGRVEIICADATDGYEKEAPFDRILGSASVHPVRNRISNGAEKIPLAWRRQVKIGGRIVVPIEQSIWLFEKSSQSEFREREYPGFVFVPLVSKQ